MEQESSHELLGRKRHGFDSIMIVPVPVGKGDGTMVDGEDAVVGDSNAVRIAAQIFKYPSRACKRTFGVGNPGSLCKGCEKRGKSLGRCRVGCRTREDQFSVAIGSGKVVQVPVFKLLCQGLYSEEKRLMCRNPKVFFKGEHPGGDKAMEMEMVHKRLRPGMEHGNATESAIQMPCGVFGKGGKRVIDRGKEDVQGDPFVAEDDWIQLMGQGEDQVKIAAGE